MCLAASYVTWLVVDATDHGKVLRLSKFRLSLTAPQRPNSPVSLYPSARAARPHEIAGEMEYPNGT